MTGRVDQALIGLAVAGAVLLGVVTAWDNTLGLAAVGALMGAGAAAWLATRPRAAFAVWLLVLCAVPVWYSIEIVVSLPPASLAFLVVLPAVMRAQERMRAPDWWLLGFATACAVGAAWFDSPRHAIGSLAVQAAPFYLVGRRLAPAAGKEWAYRAIAVATTVVAAWACVEFLLSWHPFEGVGVWQPIQTRGPVVRSEAAFGHSIALGGFVAIGIPFALAADFRTHTHTRLLLLAVLAGGLICSFSRGPILGGVLAFALVVLFLRSSQLHAGSRWGLFGVVLFGALVVGPRVLGFFSALDPTELTGSAEYRRALLDHAADDLNLFGQADKVTVGSDGETLYRGVQSIDNAWLLTGLQFGWVPLLLLVALVAAGAWRVVAGRAGPAEVALVSQAFVLGTVALITQYGAAVWMLAGLAVAFAQQRPLEPEATRSPEPERIPARTGR